MTASSVNLTSTGGFGKVLISLILPLSIKPKASMAASKVGKALASSIAADSYVCFIVFACPSTNLSSNYASSLT